MKFLFFLVKSYFGRKKKLSPSLQYNNINFERFWWNIVESQSRSYICIWQLKFVWKQNTMECHITRDCVVLDFGLFIKIFQNISTINFADRFLLFAIYYFLLDTVFVDELKIGSLFDCSQVRNVLIGCLDLIKFITLQHFKFGLLACHIPYLIALKTTFYLAANFADLIDTNKAYTFKRKDTSTGLISIVQRRRSNDFLYLDR